MKAYNQFNSEVNNLIRKKKYKEALEIINEYVVRTNDPYIYVSKAHVLVVGYGRIEEAKVILESVLKCSTISFPTRKYALNEMARIACLEKDEEKALECYYEIINKSNYVEPSIRCKMANIYITRRMYDKVFEILDIPNFNNEAMNAKRCKAYIQQKQFDKAFEALEYPIFTSNLSIDSNDINMKRVENETNYYYGCIYHTYFNDLDKAILYFNKVLNTNDINDPSYYSAIVGILSAYFSKQDYIKCREYCELFIRKANTAKNIYNKVIKTYVRTYIETGDYDIALGLARKYSYSTLELYVQACMNINSFDFIGAFEKLNSILSFDEGFNVEIEFKKLVCMYRLNKVDEFDRIFEGLVKDSLKSKYMYIEAQCMKQILYKKNNLECEDKVRSYYTKQIKSYNENELKIYMLYHFADKYRENTNFSNLILETKKRVEVMTPTCGGLYDIYKISYIDEFGDNNSLIVKCLPDTKDIIIIVPSINEVKEHNVEAKTIRLDN